MRYTTYNADGTIDIPEGLQEYFDNIPILSDEDNEELARAVREVLDEEE